MTEPEAEVPAVLNIDPGQTLAAITSALRSFAKTVPQNAGAKIVFSHEPDVSDSSWNSSVKLQVFGGLTQVTASTAPTGEFLANVEPQLLGIFEWAAEGPDFFESVSNLAEEIEGHLKSLIATRQHDLEAAEEALTTLHNHTFVTNTMPTMWATQDNPEDESAQEEQPTD